MDVQRAARRQAARGGGEIYSEKLEIHTACHTRTVRALIYITYNLVVINSYRFPDFRVMDHAIAATRSSRTCSWTTAVPIHEIVPFPLAVVVHTATSS